MALNNVNLEKQVRNPIRRSSKLPWKLSSGKGVGGTKEREPLSEFCDTTTGFKDRDGRFLEGVRWYQLRAARPACELHSACHGHVGEAELEGDKAGADSIP